MDDPRQQLMYAFIIFHWKLEQRRSATLTGSEVEFMPSTATYVPQASANNSNDPSWWKKTKTKTRGLVASHRESGTLAFPQCRRGARAAVVPAAAAEASFLEPPTETNGTSSFARLFVRCHPPPANADPKGAARLGACYFSLVFSLPTSGFRSAPSLDRFRPEKEASQPGRRLSMLRPLAGTGAYS